MIATINKIIVSGTMGSGKDTVVDYICEKYGHEKLFFAEPIYEIARKYFGMDGKNRVLLQSIGQKMREIEPNIWVNYTFRQAKQYNKVAVSDMRQQNEYLVGINEGFYPIRVVANIDICIQRLRERDGVEPDVSRFEHEAEKGADKYEMTEIHNNGTLEELYEQIDKLMGG